MPRILWCALLATSFLATACGGAQHSGDAARWSSAFDAVPVDASYAYAVDLSAIFSSEFSVATLLTDAFEDQGLVGVEPLLAFVRDPTTAGVDPDGSLAIFSTTLLPVLVVELSDADTFEQYVADVMERMERQSGTPVEHAGVRFTRWSAADTDWFFDVGHHAGHGVIRVGALEDTWALMDDSAFAALLTAPRSARWVSTDTYATLIDAAPSGATPTGFSIFQTAPLAEVFEQVAVTIAERDIEERGTASLMFRGETHQQRCREAAAALAEAIPGIYSLQTQYPSELGVIYHGVTDIPMSRELASRMRAVLTPVSALAGTAFDDVVFAIESGIRPFELMRQVTADADLRDCPTIAAGPAAMAYQAELESSDIDEMSALFDGTGLFALFELDLAAQIPNGAFLAAAGSPDAPGLSALVEEAIRGNGITPTVDETAAVTTLEYNLFFVVLRVLQLSDRLVFDLNAPAGPAVDTASTSQATGDTFARVRINGRELAKLLRDVIDYTSEMGIPGVFDSMSSALDVYSRILRIEMDAMWHGDHLRTISVSEMRRSAP